MKMQKERELIVEYGRLLKSSGLCPGTSGNLSICSGDRRMLAISPSGMDYDSLTPEDIVVTDLDANVIDGKRRPSSEWALHTLFYRKRPDISAVVHTHSLYCTTFAVLHEPIRAVHFAIAGAGATEVRCAPYALFGSEELAETAVSFCGSDNAVLLANHGILCCGMDISKAYSLAVDLEYCAKLQYQASCIGTPQFISAGQMQDVLKQFSGYGQ